MENVCYINLEQNVKNSLTVRLSARRISKALVLLMKTERNIQKILILNI